MRFRDDEELLKDVIAQRKAIASTGAYIVLSGSTIEIRGSYSYADLMSELEEGALKKAVKQSVTELDGRILP